MLDNQEQGMTITNQCYECMVIERDKLAGYAGGNNCQTCQEDKEARLSSGAHNIVEEGNDQYKHTMLRVDEPISASDWISSHTVSGKARKKAVLTEKWQDESMILVEMSVKFIDQDDPWLIRNEFSAPIVQLIDGGEHEEYWELDDYTQRQRETVCQWCNILTPKMFNDCQSCDKPLENNLSTLFKAVTNYLNR